MSRPETLGHLKETGWVSVPVKEELRRNAIARIAAGDTLFPGVMGYDDTVLPGLENALLAGHDIIFLGERGQAKTRMIRLLVELLDEWMPIIAGSEINDDPYHPVSRHAKALIEEHGDDAPIDWVHRSDRFGEKLATPDTSIADLIGEVDPIKVAEGRYLSDELTLHYGLVPRTNRGIFAINELPDLAERIQVGLLNVLEERDIQVRGYKIRLPLDLLLVASANPEDYTNRGRIITPLKDRFGAQIRTHYPAEVELEREIAEQEAVIYPSGDIAVTVPDHMADIVATLTHLARDSAHINQRSGVSVRLTVANYETMVAAAVRRTLRQGEAHAVPRVSDLAALLTSTLGKVEIETLEEGRETSIVDNLVKSAVLTVFKQRTDAAAHRALLEAFDGGTVVNAGDDIPSADYLALVESLPALADEVTAVGLSAEQQTDPAQLASAVEFVLEGLHLSKRLNKEAVGGSGVYRASRVTTREIGALCVYCASSAGHDPQYIEAATAVGRLCADNGITLVYGGGAVGLMGAAADGCLDAGGSVVGIIPTGLFSREVAHRRVTELIEVRSMHERKQLMYERSDAFVALPGGLGTLEEVAEMATWGQLGIHRKPIAMLDVVGYWTGLRQWLDTAVDAGLLKPANRALISWVDAVDGLLPALRAYDVPYVEKWLDSSET